MMLLIDVSQNNILTPAQWDILGKILDGVIIRLSYGITEDMGAKGHIEQANRVGLPFAGFHWADPTWDFTIQMNKYKEVVKRYKPVAMFNDYEQYWADWSAYTRKDYTEAYRTRFTPEQLNNFYLKFYNTSKLVGIPIGNYSSNTFIKYYCPQMKDWVVPNNYWRASYPDFPDIYLPEDVRAKAETIAIGDGIARQFAGGGLNVTGLPPLDWDVFTDESFERMFLMKKILDVPFISQLGAGASAHNNDCGPACCSMVLAAVMDNVVNPDDWYAMDGWGAPGTDIGTTAYQLQKALNLFNLKTSIIGAMPLSSIYTIINNNALAIALVKYDYFSDLGYTYYKGHFNHWLVVIGYNDSSVITLDPYRPESTGGIMIVPADLFAKSYLGTSLVSVVGVGEGEVPVTTNATVINCTWLNVRSTPVVTPDNKIGGVPGGQKVFIDKEETGWGHITTPLVGWLSLSYILKDIIVTPPPPPPPPPVPTLGEKDFRLDELKHEEPYVQQVQDALNVLKSYLDARKELLGN